VKQNIQSPCIYWPISFDGLLVIDSLLASNRVLGGVNGFVLICCSKFLLVELIVYNSLRTRVYLIQKKHDQSSGCREWKAFGLYNIDLKIDYRFISEVISVVCLVILVTRFDEYETTFTDRNETFLKEKKMVTRKMSATGKCLICYQLSLKLV